MFEFYNNPNLFIPDIIVESKLKLYSKQEKSNFFKFYIKDLVE